MAIAVERNTVARVSGWPLTAVRLAWLIAAGLGLVLLVPEIQATVAASKHLCPGTNPLNCTAAQVTGQTLQALHSIGISRALYTGYTITLLLVVNAAAYALAVMLMARRSTDRMVIVAAFACLFVNISSFQTPGGTWAEVSHAAALLNQLSGALFFFLFPSGRFVPRWSVLLAAGYIAVAFLPSNSGWSFLLYAFFLLCIIVLQVYRYRWVSTPLQRQQTKLVVLGIAMFIFIFVAAVVAFIVDAGLFRQPVPFLVYQSAIDLAQLPILLGAGFAILRYRLWDVDVLINRSLVYLALSVTLGGFYIASVIGLQAISQAVTGRQSDLAVAVSTLVIAALFNPWRHRIQRLIDRSFYRRRYDAAQILATFGSKLRNQTDLDELSQDLIAAVHEAMGSSHIALQLYPTPRRDEM